MKVKEVMRKAFVIDKDIRLEEAAKLMSKKDIGCLIFISKGEKVKGIITEGDLLAHFNTEKTISEVMETDVLTITPSANVKDALKLMKVKGIRRLPVVKSGKLVGIIRMREIAAKADELGEDFFF